MRTIRLAFRLALALLLGLSPGAFGQAAPDRDREQRSVDILRPSHNDPDVFDVRKYGARGDGLADDSAAIASAATAAAASSAAGQPGTLYFPAGIYRLVTPLPTWTVMVSVLGDGPERSVVLVDGALSGDVFSWSEVWAGGNYPNEGPTISPLTTQKAGVEIKGIRIAGTRAASHLQNAFVFYDRADFVFMHDVEVSGMTGRALYSGVMKRVHAASMRESRLQDLRFAQCGSAGVAAVEFNSEGIVDVTNEVNVERLDISAPFGTGLLIHNSSTNKGISMKIADLRIAGQENAAIAADLVQVGDASLVGNINNVDFARTELINPYPGYAAIRFAAPNPAVAPYQVRLQGRIEGGAGSGKGIVIEAGRSLFFDLDDLHTADVNVTVAKTAGQLIVLNGHGQEVGWTRSIDPSSVAKVKRPVSNTLQQF